MLNPKLSKVATNKSVKLPTPNARLWVNPKSANAPFLCVALHFSASNELVEDRTAASEMPSRSAAIIRTKGLVVRTKTAMATLAITFPIIRIFLLPYLSAAIPSGILPANAETPIVVIIIPINSEGNP